MKRFYPVIHSPAVFPQFGIGPQSTVQHGYARLLPWDYLGVLTDSKDQVSIRLMLRSGDQTQKYWSGHPVNLTFTVTLHHRSLEMHLGVDNRENKESISFTALLHTYIRVQSIHDTSVLGLKDVEYVDKVSQTREVESRNHVAFEKEVDRIYLDGGKCDLTVLQNAVPTVQLQSLNFRDCVVWNPWIEKSKAMADFDDDEYLEMVCLELGNVHEAVTLLPGQEWSAGQILKYVE